MSSDYYLDPAEWKAIPAFHTNYKEHVVKYRDHNTMDLASEVGLDHRGGPGTWVFTSVSFLHVQGSARVRVC